MYHIEYIIGRNPMLVRAVAATTNVGSSYDRFSPEALQQLAGGAVGLKVLKDFDAENSIGTVVHSEVKDGKLIVQCAIAEEFLQKYPSYVVPGFKAIEVIHGTGVCELCSVAPKVFGLVEKPCDLSLSPLSIMEA